MATSFPELEEESIHQFETKVDKVYTLLEKLSSTDENEVKCAEVAIDKYLAENKYNNKPGGYEEDGCKVTSSKSCINKKLGEAENRIKLSEEYKQVGNEAFRTGDYKSANELYTSAILQRDDNAILFTNRAQARIKLGQFEEGVNDAKKAMKLNPDSVKAHVHCARGLKELGEFQEAIDVLERAENIAQDHADVVRKYKLEMIEERKKAFVQQQ